MIRNIALVILAGLLMTCHSRGTNEKTQTPAKPDLSKLGIVIIDVKGMTCTGCEKTIARNVASLDGINACEVSHIEGIARIEFDTSLTTIMHITDAIEKSGYQVEDVHIIHDPTETKN